MDPTLVMDDISRPVRSSAVRAWVNVIYGCNEHCTYCVVPYTRGVEQSQSMEAMKHCTYCVVPYTRGVEQSRSMEAMEQDILDLASKGYIEVTLLGQNIDAYGRDMNPKRTFAFFLYFLNDAVQGTDIKRMRYITGHPRYFSDRVIDAVANLDKVCECFHVPFQVVVTVC